MKPINPFLHSPLKPHKTHKPHKPHKQYGTPFDETRSPYG